MTIPSNDTIVSFADGAGSPSSVSSRSTVLHVETLDEHRSAVLLDTTACHPVDAGWPDQGADRAVLSAGGQRIPLLDCVLAASDGQALYLGGDIPVRKGTEGWAFFVAHVIATDAAAILAEGTAVTVDVVADYRQALSAGHTGCHLASLALNRALAGRWSKEARSDTLGSPDFDASAIDTSLIRENGSTDRYRLNKSLRRKGFGTDGLAEELDAVRDAVQLQLDAWIASGAAITIEREGPGLTDRRAWVCALPEGNANIPCGGTHLDSLAALGGLSVAFQLADEDGTPVLTMDIDAA